MAMDFFLLPTKRLVPRNAKVAELPPKFTVDKNFMAFQHVKWFLLNMHCLSIPNFVCYTVISEVSDEMNTKAWIGDPSQHMLDE